MNISPTLNLAWQLAAQETVAARKQEIGPVQMFCGIAKVDDLIKNTDIVPTVFKANELESARGELSLTLSPLSEQGIDLTLFRRELRARVGTGDRQHAPHATVSRSQVLKALFDRAQILCGDDNEGIVTTRHVVMAMLEDRNLLVTSALSERQIDIEGLLQRLRDPASGPMPREKAAAKPSVQGSTPFLDRFGRDLTELARRGAIGPVIGRRQEVLQVMQTLMRRTKSNPVLVGEPGVGKTAVAELLAMRIATRDCVEAFRDCRVVELSLSTLLAGASHAGEREQRLTGVLNECRGSGNVILFIDELHTLIKAGGLGGAVDPSDIFKPALARGEIRCIGATTHDEYARYIETDGALARRFEKVTVAEPSSEAAVEIMRGLRQTLEVHHGVSIPDETLSAAVELSVRFDTNRQLPDKAIDLLDLAAARVRLPRLSLVASADDQAVAPLTVGRDAVIAALAVKLGVPVELVSAGAQSRNLDGLAAFLKSRIVGQDEAIDRIVHRLHISQAQLRERRGPLGVFLFTGATGVGKTALAQALGAFLFGAKEALIRIDMSEYQEEHSVAKLIGAPPGYVGHESAGQLTGALRAHPYSVILLDEIDKAHPKVFDLFLQLFDEGRLTDAKGRTADARHAIFVLTGNIGPTQNRGIGFVANTVVNDIDTELRRRFRPEFLNRIDERICFAPLSPEHVGTLIDKAFGEIAANIRQRHGVELRLQPAAFVFLQRHGYSAEYGARHLQRTIERYLELPLIDLLKNGLTTKCVAVSDGGDRLEFQWTQ